MCIRDSLDRVGGRGVGEGRDVVFHAGARRDRVEAFARGQAAFLRAVEPHAVEAAAQGGGLGREAVSYTHLWEFTDSSRAATCWRC